MRLRSSMDSGMPAQPIDHGRMSVSDGMALLCMALLLMSPIIFKVHLGSSVGSVSARGHRHHVYGLSYELHAHERRVLDVCGFIPHHYNQGPAEEPESSLRGVYGAVSAGLYRGAAIRTAAVLFSGSRDGHGPEPFSL